MSERRIGEKRVIGAIANLRTVGEKYLTDSETSGASATEYSAIGNAYLAAAFEFETELGFAHPHNYAKPINFEVRREVFLPGRFIRALDGKTIDFGAVRKTYVNGDIKLVATSEQLQTLRDSAESYFKENGPEANRGVKTAARAIIKQLEKNGILATA